MKIIFDSEEQKETFLGAMTYAGLCPYEAGIDIDCVERAICRDCWEDAIESEVKK